MFMRSLAAGGQPMPAPRTDAISASAIRRWREAAFDLERSSKVSEAADYWQALLVFTPNDDALVLHAVELLLETGRTGAARRQLDGLAADDDIWGRLAGARLAVLDGAPETAIARYHDAFPLATDYDTLSEIGNGLRDLGDAAGAQQAFEQAANLAPDSIWPLVAIGDLLRESDPAAARTWYERARQLDPNTGYQQESGYPDYALGRLLADTGDDIAALPLLEAAVEKEPDRHEFRALLEEVRARLGGS
jgi:tetratricopeptide (TPR) repeat protein